jgi:hypothetical protein
MHDCLATKARLIDLVCGGTNGDEALLAQVRSCAACAVEHRALAETLRAFDRAADAARPPEEFWTSYHARLAQSIHAVEAETSSAFADDVRPLAPPFEHAPSPAASARLASLVSRLRGALAVRWSVPAPVAVAAVLLIACLAPLALRAPRPAAEPPAGESESAHAARTPQQAFTANESRQTPAANQPQQVRTIEIPVVREKIVTRTVYVTRPARGRAARAGDAGRAEAPNEAPGRDALTGFQPAGDVRLRVIKGSWNER